MSEFLVNHSFYDKGTCSVCQTKWNASPKGMFKHVRLDASGVEVKSTIVCAICVYHSHADHYKNIPIKGEVKHF